MELLPPDGYGNKAAEQILQVLKPGGQVSIFMPSWREEGYTTRGIQPLVESLETATGNKLRIERIRRGLPKGSSSPNYEADGTRFILTIPK